MPLPSPDSGESEDDFIDRCMGDDEAVEECPDPSQRRAVCESQWEDSDMTSKPVLNDGEMLMVENGSDHIEIVEPLDMPIKRLRSTVARGVERVEREGGEHEAGLIHRYSVIARGEAVGHEMWVDDEMLRQVATAINRTGRTGVKARFTHPGLTGDGLGKFLGRTRDAAVVGDRVLADLHFSESAHHTPDGDLAGYVMDLAEQDPKAFGTSITFDEDEEAMQAWREKNAKSRDPKNGRNLIHVRLKKLYATDIVDDPASNPDGLFSRGMEIPIEADKLLNYLFVHGETPPELQALGINAERVKAFVARWQEMHHRSISVLNTTDAGALAETYDRIAKALRLKAEAKRDEPML